MTPDDLKAYAQVMRDMAVRRLEGEEDDGRDFCIEMDPSAFVRTALADTAPAMPEPDESERCACGCLKDAEHNAQGLCIGKGCPVSLCSPEAAKEKGT